MMKRIDQDMAVERFLNRKPVTVESLFKNLRVHVLHELVFFRDGSDVLKAISMTEFDLFIRESSYLLKVGRISDDLHQELRERLRPMKVRLGQLKLFFLEQCLKDRSVQDRIWTPHLEDRILSLIATRKGKSYVRKHLGQVSDRLKEMIASQDIEPEGGEILSPFVQEGEISSVGEEVDGLGADVIMAEIVSQGGPHRHQAEVLFLPPTVISNEDVGTYAVTLSRQEDVEIVKKKPNSRDVEIVRVVPASQKVGEIISVAKSPYHFYQLPDLETVARTSLIASLLVMRSGEERNLAVNVFSMVAQSKSLDELNESFARVYDNVIKHGVLPEPWRKSEGEPLSFRLSRMDFQGIETRSVRRDSLMKLGYVNHNNLVVTFSERVNVKHYFASCKEMVLCYEVLKFLPPRIFAHLMCEWNNQYDYVMNNPVVTTFLSATTLEHKSAADAAKLGVEARLRTWGPVPIAFFTIVCGKVVPYKVCLDPKVESYIAYQGDLAHLLRVNMGLPGTRQSMSSASDVPLALMTGPGAALRVGDPAMGILDSSWNVYRLPPYSYWGIKEKGKDIGSTFWISVARFQDICISCRPMIIEGGNRGPNFGIPMGLTEVAGVQKSSPEILQFSVKGWSQCMCQTRPYEAYAVPGAGCFIYTIHGDKSREGKVKCERVMVPMQKIPVLGVVWLSRTDIQY